MPSSAARTPAGEAASRPRARLAAMSGPWPGTCFPIIGVFSVGSSFRSSLELLLQPDPRDVVDLLQGVPELRHRVVVQALLEQVEDAELGVVAHRDHEGEAE